MTSIQQFLEKRKDAMKLTGNQAKLENCESTIAVEIDLSQPKKIEVALGINKLDCCPVLWVWQAKEKVKWTVPLKQKIACKYLLVKMIDIFSQEVVNKNVDMFALEVAGLTLDIPNSNQ